MTREQKKVYGFVGGSAGVLIIALVGAIFAAGGVKNEVENQSRIIEALTKELVLVKEVAVETKTDVKNIDYRVRRIENKVNGDYKGRRSRKN